MDDDTDIGNVLIRSVVSTLGVIMTRQLLDQRRRNNPDIATMLAVQNSNKIDEIADSIHRLNNVTVINADNIEELDDELDDASLLREVNAILGGNHVYS